MNRFWSNPLTVLFLAVYVILFLMVKVVPTFNDVFVSFGEKLPASTEICVSVSNWVLKNKWVFAVMPALYFGLAGVYEKKLEKLDWSKWLIVVIVLGFLIGFIVFAMFMPMFELGDVVKN